MDETLLDHSDFCSKRQCPEFIVWSYGYGECFSCKLVGESHIVDTIPENCIHLKDITEWAKETL